MASAWETPGPSEVAMAMFEAVNRIAVANRLRVRFLLKRGIGMFVMLSHVGGLLQRADEQWVEQLRGRGLLKAELARSQIKLNRLIL
jgi:hypothetical protein